MEMTQSEAARTPRCKYCGTSWHQAGNRSGHCTGCHLTFSSLSAFTRHQRTNDGVTECLAPGHEKWKLVPRTDTVGTTQWGFPGGDIDWSVLRDESED